MARKNTLENAITLAVIATAITSCARFGETSVTSPTNSSSLSPCTTSGAGNCEVTQSTFALLDTSLIAANILNGITIFGVTGNAGGVSSALMSNIHRDKGTIPWSIVKESVTDRGLAYTNNTIRAVPKVKLDDDGFTGENITYVDRTGWNNTSCGTSQATIDGAGGRIAHCATVFGAEATWDGAVKGNSGQSVWKLVVRTGNIHASGRAREVWRDERTGLLWSSLVSGSADDYIVKTAGSETGGGGTTDDNKRMNWCKASGANKITGNAAAGDDDQGYCDGAVKFIGNDIWNQAPDDTPGNDNDNFQTASGNAISACFEGTGFVNSDTISISRGDGEMIDNAGKAGLGLS